MPDIVHRIEVAAPLEAVERLVSTRAGFRAWWAEDVQVKSDGTVELGFFDRTTVYRLRPAGAEPGRLAAWTCQTGQEWSGTRIVFEMAAQGRTTVVRFTHGDWQKATDFFTSCNTTWGELLFRLKAAAEGKGRGPLFLASTLAY